MKKMFLIIAAALLTQMAVTATTYKTEHVAISVDEPRIPALTVSIADFGGVPDGMTLNTDAFHKAMDYLKQKAGGGTVVVPGGCWLTGPLMFRSNIRLELQGMAVLKFCPDTKLYRPLEDLYGLKGKKTFQSPLGAYRATDIEICGNGIIDGAGEQWRPFKQGNANKYEWKRMTLGEGVFNDKGDIWYPMTREEQERYKAAHKNGDTPWVMAKDLTRPYLLHFIECSRIRLQGVTFQNSPMWNLHPELCDNITIKNCTVRNNSNATNGDGIDIESCRNVYLSHTVFDVGDDGICIKSGKDEEGRKRGVPTRDVIIDSCVVYHAHGGFVVGSEMSGGVRNISVRDCIFMGTDNGLRFKSNRDRGGLVDSIFVHNIYMENIASNGILFDLYYFQPSEGREFLKNPEGYRVGGIPEKGVTTPTFRNIFIDNVTCAGAERAIYMDGLPENRIAGIHISNLRAKAIEPSLISEARNITLNRISLDDNTGGTLLLHNVADVDINAKKGKPDIKVYGGNSSNVKFR